MFVHQLFKVYCAYSVHSMFLWRVPSHRAYHYAAHDRLGASAMVSWLPQLGTIKASTVIGHCTQCLAPERHSPHVLPSISPFRMDFLTTPSLTLLYCCICTLYFFCSSSQSLSNSPPCAVSFVSVSAVFTTRTVSLPWNSSPYALVQHSISSLRGIVERALSQALSLVYRNIVTSLFQFINVAAFFIRPFYLPIDIGNLTTKVFWRRLWERKQFLSQIFTINTFFITKWFACSLFWFQLFWSHLQ